MEQVIEQEVKPDYYIEISNKGEVDINAFKLLGASAKNDDNSIGFFWKWNKIFNSSIVKKKGRV